MAGRGSQPQVHWRSHCLYGRGSWYSTMGNVRDAQGYMLQTPPCSKPSKEKSQQGQSQAQAISGVYFVSYTSGVLGSLCLPCLASLLASCLSLAAQQKLLYLSTLRGTDAFDVQGWRVTMDQPAEGNLLHPGWEQPFQGKVWGSGIGGAGLGVEILIGRGGMLKRTAGNAEDKGLELGV